MALSRVHTSAKNADVAILLLLYKPTSGNTYPLMHNMPAPI